MGKIINWTQLGKEIKHKTSFVNICDLSSRFIKMFPTFMNDGSRCPSVSEISCSRGRMSRFMSPEMTLLYCDTSWLMNSLSFLTSLASWLPSMLATVVSPSVCLDPLTTLNKTSSVLTSHKLQNRNASTFNSRHQTFSDLYLLF